MGNKNAKIDDGVSLEDIISKIMDEADDADIPINKIIVAEIPCRLNGDGEKFIDELAYNIRKVGLIHPIIVAPSNVPNQPYQVIAGSRRYMACDRLGMNYIKARSIRQENLDPYTREKQELILRAISIRY